MIRLLLAAAFGPALLAQESGNSNIISLNVYPVRVDHKQGYIKIFFQGTETIIDTVIPPRFDYVSDEALPWNRMDDHDGPASPYRLFEINEKVGMLGPSLKEVLPARFNRIRAVSPALFAVEDEENALFYLIDTAMNVLLGGDRYEDIFLIGAESDPGQPLFWVKANGLFGVRDLAGSVRTPVAFTSILPAGVNGYFKVRTEDSGRLWRIIDSSGNWVVQNTFQDLAMLSENFIFARKSDFWYLLKKNELTDSLPGVANTARPAGTTEKPASRRKATANSHTLEEGKYVFVQRVNDSLAMLVTRHTVADSAHLWHTGKQPAILQSFLLETQVITLEQGENTAPGDSRASVGTPWFFPLDDRYVVKKLKGGAQTSVEVLADYSGEEQSAKFQRIHPSGMPHVYKVQQEDGWGLLQPGQPPALVFECAYDTIFDFKGAMAIARQGSKLGILAFAGGRGIALPCRYDAITRLDDQRARAQFGEMTVYLRFTPETGFVEDSVRIVRAASLFFSKDADYTIKEAVPAQKRSASRDNTQALPERVFTTWQKEEGGDFGFSKRKPYRNALGSIIRTETLWEQVLPERVLPQRIIELDPDKTFAMYYRGKPVVSPFIQEFIGHPLATIRLYQRGQNRFLDELEIIGIRAFDHNYPYTAFMDAEGQMGLMDRHGKQLLSNGKPLRYTYIGPFVAGKARACIGGKLVIDSKEAQQESTKFAVSRHSDLLDDLGMMASEGQPLAARTLQNVFVIATPDSPRRWAYIDTTGQVALQPDADFVTDFHWADSTAFILRKNRGIVWERPDADYGIIDRKGREIAPTRYTTLAHLESFKLASVDSTPTFYFTQKGIQLFVNRTRLRPFSEGLAHFRDPLTDLWGYVDTTGSVAISPRFQEARPFSGGRALVVDQAGTCVFIDPAGQVAFSTRKPSKGSQFIGDFNDGRCWIKDEGRSWSWTCYDTGGNPAFTPGVYYQPSQAHAQPTPPDMRNPLPMDFSRGTAVAARLNAQGKPYYLFIDTAGAVQGTYEKYSHIGPFDEWGLAVITGYDRKKGLIDNKGEVRVPPKYAAIEPFINGYAKVKGPEGKWGLVNLDGRAVLSTTYAVVDTVSEGMVAVKFSEYGGWSFVDTSNQIKIRGTFDRAGIFKEGLALVEQRNSSRIINRQGNEVVLKSGKPKFFSEGFFGMSNSGAQRPGLYYADASGNNTFGRYFQEITPFRLGVAGVKRLSIGNREELYGAINRRGVPVVPPKYRTLNIQPDGSIITNPQRFYGLLDGQGNILVPPEYDRIEQFDMPGLLRVERGEEVGYMRIMAGKAEWIWPLQK